MLSERVDEEIAELCDQIRRADQRCDEAWQAWDEEAYEGACIAREKLYSRLRELQKAEPKETTSCSTK